MSVISERSTHSRHSARTAMSSGRQRLPMPTMPTIHHDMDMEDPAKAMLLENSRRPYGSYASSLDARMRLQLAVDDQGFDNTTVVTGNTSEHSYSGITDRFYMQSQPFVRVSVRRCSRFCWIFLSMLISSIALLSAPVMLATPLLVNMAGIEWPPIHCDVDCQGKLLNIAVKTVLLIVAFYVIFWKTPAAEMPRLYLARATFIFFVCFILFAFWLFFTFRYIMEQAPTFITAVNFAQSLVDVLIFIHCIWIFYEMRQRQPYFVVTVTRDPDGESKTFQLGHFSIQQSAVAILQIYTAEFPSFNFFLDRARKNDRIEARSRFGAGQRPSGFKMYDFENLGPNSGVNENSARALMEAATRQRLNHRNDRLYEELEWERRVNKRKYRLIDCTEEAFGYVQQLSPNSAKNYRGEAMTSAKMASSVLGGIARPLNRYLKLTRQQPQHYPETVLGYLQKCLKYRFGPKTFLQRFFSSRFPDSEISIESKWSIICDHSVSGRAFHGLEFVLRSFNPKSDIGVQLYCTFSALPFFNITEQCEKDTKFALKLTADP